MTNSDIMTDFRQWFKINSETTKIAGSNEQIIKVLNKNLLFKQKILNSDHNVDLTDTISSIGVNMSELATVKFNVSTESRILKEGKTRKEFSDLSRI